MERQRYGGERSRQRWGRKMNNVGETKKDVDELMDRSIRTGKILWQRYAFCDIERGREIMIYKDIKKGTKIKGGKDVNIKKKIEGWRESDIDKYKFSQAGKGMERDRYVHVYK